MDQHQQNVRRAAAKAFLDSLNQLETSLQSADKAQDAAPIPVLENPMPTCATSDLLTPEYLPTEQPDPPCNEGLDGSVPEAYVEVLAEAAADIEQFIQSLT